LGREGLVKALIPGGSSQGPDYDGKFHFTASRVGFHKGFSGEYFPGKQVIPSGIILENNPQGLEIARDGSLAGDLQHPTAVPSAKLTDRRRNS
jgi:hypothetical protein